MALYTAYTDDELVEMLRQGDHSAFEAAYRRHLPALYDYAYKRLKDKQQVEDVLQDLFARLWVKRETLNIADLPAYLHVAARHTIINYITRSAHVFAFYEPFEALLLEGDSPEGVLMAKELLNLVYAYAATLPEKRKQVFLLHVKDKFSTAEIAETLGISQKTVQNQLHTALEGLKGQLAGFLVLLISSHL